MLRFVIDISCIKIAKDQLIIPFIVYILYIIILDNYNPVHAQELPSNNNITRLTTPTNTEQEVPQLLLVIPRISADDSNISTQQPIVEDKDTQYEVKGQEEGVPIAQQTDKRMAKDITEDKQEQLDKTVGNIVPKKEKVEGKEKEKAERQEEKDTKEEVQLDKATEDSATTDNIKEEHLENEGKWEGEEQDNNDANGYDVPMDLPIPFP